MSQPAAIQVRPHATKGRALFAAQSFPPGSIILPFTPALLLPALSHAGSVCAHCLRPGTPRACSHCHAAAYCDAACQAAAWTAVHAKECKVLRRVAAQGRPGLPTPVRAVVQALLKTEIGDALRPLEGNVEAWRRSARWADMEMMAMGAVAFAGLGATQENVQKAIELLCKVCFPMQRSFHSKSKAHH